MDGGDECKLRDIMTLFFFKFRTRRASVEDIVLLKSLEFSTPQGSGDLVIELIQKHDCKTNGYTGIEGHVGKWHSAEDYP